MGSRLPVLLVLLICLTLAAASRTRSSARKSLHASLKKAKAEVLTVSRHDLECSGHGRRKAGGKGGCECFPSFSGAHCDIPKAAHSLHDGNNENRAEVVTVSRHGLECSGHGRRRAGGSGACECFPSFSGAHCDIPKSAHSVHSGGQEHAEVLIVARHGLECSGHGRRKAGGKGGCECFPSFSGAHCDIPKAAHSVHSPSDLSQDRAEVSTPRQNPDSRNIRNTHARARTAVPSAPTTPEADCDGYRPHTRSPRKHCPPKSAIPKDAKLLASNSASNSHRPSPSASSPSITTSESPSLVARIAEKIGLGKLFGSQQHENSAEAPAEGPAQSSSSSSSRPSASSLGIAAGAATSSLNGQKEFAQKALDLGKAAGQTAAAHAVGMVSTMQDAIASVGTSTVGQAKRLAKSLSGEDAKPKTEEKQEKKRLAAEERPLVGLMR